METSSIPGTTATTLTKQNNLPAIALWIGAHRNTIGCAFLAVSLLCNLSMRSFHSPLLGLGWVALALGVALTGVSIGNKKVFWSLVALLAFHALAIPGSIIWGSGNWELTAGVVLWMAPALLLYLAKDAQNVLAWMVPAFLIHAGVIIWQGVTSWEVVGDVTTWDGLPAGLSNNSNLAAGFLAVGAIYLLTTPLKWLSVPLLIALLFTGSRWGLIVVGAVLLVMTIARAISWRPLVVTLVVMLISVAFLGMFTPAGYAVAGVNSFASVAHALTVDVGVRLAVPHLPTFLPSGVAEHPGLHNVPLRIAVESGIIAAGLWVLITGQALISCRPITKNRQRHRSNANNTEVEGPKRVRDVLMINASGDVQHVLPEQQQRKIHRFLPLPFPSFLNPLKNTDPHERTEDQDQQGAEGESFPKAHLEMSVEFQPNAHGQHQTPPSSSANRRQHLVGRSLNNEGIEDEEQDECADGQNLVPNKESSHYRWILLTLVLLSVLDYYTWMGHLGGFWWLLIGLLVKSTAQPFSNKP